MLEGLLLIVFPNMWFWDFFFKTNFIIWTSLSSSVLLSIGLGSMLAIANYQPSLIFDSSTSNTTLTEALEHYCMVLIPLLLLSNLIYYLINKLVNNMNKHLIRKSWFDGFPSRYKTWFNCWYLIINGNKNQCLK